jgi:hypothetical protein
MSELTVSHSGLLHTGQLHSGLPPLDLSGRPVSFYEFWPPLIFYFPMFVYWAWLGLRHWGLGLPTIANPLFPVGGVIGESKLGVLDTISGPARAVIAGYAGVKRPANTSVSAIVAEAKARMAENGLTWPVVAKPDIGCRGAGVRLMKSDADLLAYVETFPPGQTFILQDFVPYEAEAGVFYVRMPDEECGKLFSLTLKYFPYVVGDGQSSLRELIERDPRAGRLTRLYLPRHTAHLDAVLPEGMPFRLAFAGSHARGAIFRNGESFITPEMSAAFDRVARSIPEFHFGRFDVRFRDLESLQRGEDFVIIEVNGAGGEATHIWDSRMSLWQAYRSLMRQYRLLWEIAARNRKRGFRPMTALQVWRKYWNELRLTANYPQTE